MDKKISIIGAGKVGETTAQMLFSQKLANNIMLIDVEKEYAEGVALDIQQTSSIFDSDVVIKGDNQISATKDSDIIIITAGMSRKPGMDRADVLNANIKIIDGIITGVKKYAKEAFIIIITNPVDVLTYYAYKKSNWDKTKIIGQAGILDSIRMSSFIAMESNFSIDDIQTLVLGNHGDTMVPLIKYTSIGGVPIKQLLDKKTIDKIIQKTRDGGAEIINLKKNSSAYNAPAAATTIMVESILNNKQRLLPCISILEGEYGLNDLAIGVPIILGEKGVHKIIELDFEKEEEELFYESAKATKKLIEESKTIIGY